MGGDADPVGGLREKLLESKVSELNSKIKGEDLKWGVKHTAAAGIVLSLGQFLSIQQFVYPRTEGEKLEQIVLMTQRDLLRVDSKHEAKSDRMYDKLEDIRKEIRMLIELQIKNNQLTR